MDPDLVARRRVHEYAGALSTPTLPPFSGVQKHARRRRLRRAAAVTTGAVAVTIVLATAGTLALQGGSHQGSLAAPVTASPTASPGLGSSLASTLSTHMWTLTDVTVDGQGWQPAAGDTATLYLLPDSYVADLGCSLTYGQLSVAGTTLVGSGGNVIGGPCTEPDADKLDTAFAALDSRLDAEVHGGANRLTLQLAGGRTRLSFAGHPRPPIKALTATQLALVGPVWQQIKPPSDSADDTPTLTLSSTQFTSFDGCGYTFGYVTFTDNGLRLRPVAHQDAPCAQTAAAFDTALTGSVEATVNSGQLLLTGGGHSFTFTEKPGASGGPFKLPNTQPPT